MGIDQIVMPFIVFHSSPCGEALDKFGWCPKCKYPPSRSDTGLREVDTATLDQQLKVAGRSFLGQFRVPIECSGEQGDSGTSKKDV
jgi:hypothetical protein